MLDRCLLVAFAHTHQKISSFSSRTCLTSQIVVLCQEQTYVLVVPLQSKIELPIFNVWNSMWCFGLFTGSLIRYRIYGRSPIKTDWNAMSNTHTQTTFGETHVDNYLLRDFVWWINSADLSNASLGSCCISKPLQHNNSVTQRPHIICANHFWNGDKCKIYLDSCGLSSFMMCDCQYLNNCSYHTYAMICIHLQSHTNGSTNYVLRLIDSIIVDR